MKNFLFYAVFLQFSFLFISCSFYATIEEIERLENFKKEVYELEKEVKVLKENQLYFLNQKHKILMGLDSCKKASKITDTIKIEE